MMPTVGVPRALLFYEFFPLWSGFFRELGCEVITSKPTTKATLDQGTALAVDETCLPLKIFYGHFLEIGEQCDFIFTPRLVSIEPKSYICPKFMGLPDLVRGLTSASLLEPIVDLRDQKTYWQRLYTVAISTGEALGVHSKVKITKAFTRGLAQQRDYRKLLLAGAQPTDLLPESVEEGKMRLRRAPYIGLIGHPYAIFDDLVNMNMFQNLRRLGYEIVTPANYPIGLVNKVARQLPKDLFWTYGRRILGTARHWYQQNLVDGIIHLVSFGCGTDSITGEIIERLTRRESKLPFLLLTVDEHTGEAGFQTRVEAFLDMIEFKKARAGGDV